MNIHLTSHERAIAAVSFIVSVMVTWLFLAYGWQWAVAWVLGIVGGCGAAIVVVSWVARGDS